MKIRFLTLIFIWAFTSLHAQQINKLNFGANSNAKNTNFSAFNPDGDYTIEMTFDAGNVGSFKCLFSNNRQLTHDEAITWHTQGYISTSRGLELWVDWGGRPTIVLARNWFVTCNTCPNLNNMSIVHLAVTKQGFVHRFYVNGTLYETVTASYIPPYLSTEIVVLGNDGQPSDGMDHAFNGDIYMARIWNLQRTVTEIAQTYNKCVSGTSAGLVAYYRTDKGAGLTLQNHAYNYRDYPLTLAPHDPSLSNNLPVWGTAPATMYYTPGPISVDAPALTVSCTPGAAVTLTATATGIGGPLQWNLPSGTIQQGYSLTVSPTQTTTYTVTGTTSMGCTSMMPATVKVSPVLNAPSVVLSPPSTCVGGTVEATFKYGSGNSLVSFARPAGAQPLYGNQIPNGLFEASTVSSSGNFSVVVKNADNCTRSANTIITVVPIPTGAQLGTAIEIGTLAIGSTYTDTKNNSIAYCFKDNFGQPSDDIYYRFTITQNAQVKIGTCNSQVTDTYLHLLSQYGTTITSNDDQGPLCNSTARASISRLLSPGTYYVVSEGYGTYAGNITTTIQVANPGGRISDGEESLGEEGMLHVVPNPTTDQIKVSQKGMKHVYNAQGVLVLSTEEDIVSVQNLPSGVYQLKMEDSKLGATFVKQ